MTHSNLFLSSETNSYATLVEQLKTTLQEMGYQLYDPFSAIPGMSYPETLRMFVAPEQGGWLRILAEQSGDDEEAIDTLVETLSAPGICIITHLDKDLGMVDVYQDGEYHEDPVATLTPYLRANYDANALKKVLLQETFNLEPDVEADNLGNIPLEDMPEELRDMVAGTDVKQRGAGKMFNRLAKRLLGGNQAAAQEFLQRDDAPDWNSRDGQFIRALMACLTVPDNWRNPDFTSVRLAYSNFKRLERRPNAMLLPGDKQAMDAVSDALSYTPIYGGK